MKRVAIAFGLLFLFFLVSALGQAPAPGAEHKKLGFWVGTWKVEAESPANPLFPAGKYSAVITGEWFEGDFQVVLRMKWTGAMGLYSELDLLGYDPAAQSYYNYVIDGTGGNQVFSGNVQGNVWSYVCNMKADGKSAKFRWTVVESSSTVITWKSEVSIENGSWILAGKAKADKM
jgi:hypothetical protein